MYGCYEKPDGAEIRLHQVDTVQVYSHSLTHSLSVYTNKGSFL